MSEKQQTNSSSSAVIAFGVIGIIILLGLGLALFVSQNGDEVDDNNTSISQEIEDDAVDGIREISPPQSLQNFTFTASNGADISLSEFAGQYILLYFGYTNCPDFCPSAMLDYSNVIESLGEDANQVTFMMISVDPERDTPELLNTYVSRYDESIVALSGNHEELERIAQDYNLTYQAQPETSAGFYTVDHTTSKFLIDPEGNLIQIFSWGLSPITITQTLRAHLDS